MDCSRFQNEVLLWFGQEGLPEELRDHLAQCPTCRAVWEELVVVSKRLGEDGLFHINDIQVERLASQVDTFLEKHEQDTVGVVTRIQKIWHAYAPVTAAAALVLGIAIGIYVAGKPAFESTVTGIPLDEASVVGLYEKNDEELNEGAVGALIYDFTTQHSYEASGWLLEDLTEEELEYLENNFNVRDLL